MKDAWLATQKRAEAHRRWDDADACAERMLGVEEQIERVSAQLAAAYASLGK